MAFANLGTTLLRAREAYKFRNIVTGISLLGFTGGVFTYSIKAVKQDDFDDIPLPPSPEISSEGEKDVSSEEHKP